MLSRFSHVQLCATPWTAAHQGPLSTGFSRQEYWSGLPFPFSLSNRKRALLNPGAVLWETPRVLQHPRGKALLGTTVHQAISASSLSGSVPGIWEAKPRQPLPLLQEILVQGVWRADTRPLPRGEPAGCAEEGGQKAPSLGKAWPL